jgi:hypothetical protein
MQLREVVEAPVKLVVMVMLVVMVEMEHHPLYQEHQQFMQVAAAAVLYLELLVLADLVVEETADSFGVRYLVLMEQ